MKQIFSLFILLTMSIIAFSQESRVPSKGLALYSKDGDFQPYEFSRHAVGDNDILIDIMYSGICHSDIHMGKSEWGNISYPFVGGHEIAGRVAQVGKNVTKFKVGDYAGIGCIINSCGMCDNCKNGLENLCEKGMVGTYASHDYFHNDKTTQGG